MATTYTWRALDAEGEPMTGPAGGEFPDQAEAEAYLAQEWEELADSGVAAVTLLCGEETVYGPMSLRPAN